MYTYTYLYALRTMQPRPRLLPQMHVGHSEQLEGSVAVLGQVPVELESAYAWWEHPLW